MDETMFTEIDLMFQVAEDWEADVLSDLRRRAGITWQCECGYSNMADESTCDGCGLTRGDES